MSTLTDTQLTSQESATGRSGPQITGVWQKVAIFIWSVLFLLSLLSCILSIASLNTWDRFPAADQPRYFPDITQEVIGIRTTFQNEVLGLGFSLPVFAYLLSAFRLIGSLALFILSAMIVRRCSRMLMAMLFAALMAVMGAAGMWNNPLFPWATSQTAWMTIPTQILGALLWFGLIMLYAFPDGRFTPRWTVALAVLLVPLAISLVFDLNFFLNPGTWPGPLPLLPNLIFIGVAFFSVLYRYAHTADPLRKQKLKGIVWGTALLMALYFILFLMNDVYSTLTGQALIQQTRGVVIYILISEPLWFVLEVVFALGAARSIFRDRLFEK
jgi:hypothetical protein